MKIVILGAGASYDHGVKNGSKPPLSKGFFKGAIAETIIQQYRELTDYLQNIFGLSIHELENTDIEELAELIDGSWQLDIYRRKDIEKKYGASFLPGGPGLLLRSFIIDHLSLSTRWLKETVCPYHKKLFTSQLSNGGSVVSFNYDLIADLSLIETGLWSGRGYFKSYFENIYDKSKPVSILKPHGSDQRLSYLPAGDD